MVIKTVDLQEAQIMLPELVALVQEGTEVILTNGDTPLVKLTPVRDFSAVETIRWRHKPEDVEKRIAALDAALDGFWDGFTPEEVDEILEAMNSEYVEPEGPELFAWIDELPEDER